MAEYIDETLPEDVRKIIHAARIAMFDDESFMQQAIAGSESLEESAARMILMVVHMVENQLGPDAELDDEELFQVITHLAGSLAEFAQAAGDPDAQDLATATEAIRGRTMELFAEEPDDEEGEAMPAQMSGAPMPPEQGPPPQGGEFVPQGGLMFGGGV